MSETPRAARNASPTLASLIEARLSRRQALLGGAATSLAALFGPQLLTRPALAATGADSTLTFTELAKVYDGTHHVAEGYEAKVLLRWGDPIVAGAPAFDPANQTAAAQAGQFGANNDFIGYVPLPYGSGASDHGLLCVNSEYPDPFLMFPGITEDDQATKSTREQVDVAMEAAGHNIVEIERRDGVWQVVPGSPYNRRITVTTEIAISGPAAGHKLMQTSADPTGTIVLGTIYNCCGGITPWGTILTCEEGASDTFGGDPAKTPDPALLDRYGYDGSDYYGRARFYDRFVLDREPNEPHRFDWVVEIDPYEPGARPVKRTALGRMSHEGANTVLNKDGRVVVYMGDDDEFEYLYRFVSKGTVDRTDRSKNRDLLDEGTLSVARLDADGTLTWVPLVHGAGPLTAANGFADQAEVLIKARLAGDAVGATRMDRPEDFEPNPVTGRIYAVMTNNEEREPDDLDAANTRGPNAYGQIVELIPPGEGADADHAADTYRWDMFLMAGNPADPEHGARYNAAVSENGWFACPDNLAFDPQGRMWIATDGATDFGIADGIYGADTDGPGRALPKLLFACPTAAEATGPCFTPDGTTLFVSVQHPGEDSTYDAPSTRWPDFDDAMPPRPAVVAITRKGGGVIGS
jgi:secreted PhoX family phosphatase